MKQRIKTKSLGSYGISVAKILTGYILNFYGYIWSNQTYIYKVWWQSDRNCDFRAF